MQAIAADDAWTNFIVMRGKAHRHTVLHKVFRHLRKLHSVKEVLAVLGGRATWWIRGMTLSASP